MYIYVTGFHTGLFAGGQNHQRWDFNEIFREYYFYTQKYFFWGGGGGGEYSRASTPLYETLPMYWILQKATEHVLFII